ncbi:hypothetical protein [Halobacillus litoralis]|uniref:hypothetical protein n=1 Tax=Halobacillus litoralis TaxID=45668 RepID=UPI002492A301|nr:hypothetical protein [Halobacillus litoralis]
MKTCNFLSYAANKEAESDDYIVQLGFFYNFDGHLGSYSFMSFSTRLILAVNTATAYTQSDSHL